ncbi:MAG TPA: phosphotransferase [Acidobacteriaceae bacterium]|nr:phosphotransferase [Acidobacteriaceae bacterium]
MLTVSPRPFSAASVVETRNARLPAQSVFIKRHAAAVRSREGLLEEHRLLQYLSRTHSSQGAAMAQEPLADDNGETVQAEGNWVYEVHPVANGNDLYREAHSWTPFLSETHALQAGRALASLHLALAGYNAPPRAPQPLVTSWTIFADDDPISAMDDYLASRPSLRQYAEERRWRDSMQQSLLPWHRQLHGYLPYLKPLWAHNDFHASNLMWSDDSPSAHVTAIVDFGLADRTNAVHDIATAIERNCVEWLRMGQSGIVAFDQIDALLTGYDEIKPLPSMERHALAAMLPLVHCEFALSETDYYLSVLNDPAKAYLGYEGYFLGHAEWFHSQEGATLLQHLQQWAKSARCA